MTTDPTTYIIAAALLGAAIGFFAHRSLTRRRSRRANFEGFKEAVRFYDARDKEARESRL